jgi:hypothetical protein
VASRKDLQGCVLLLLYQHRMDNILYLVSVGDAICYEKIKQESIFVSQWKLLNVITDNVIIWLMRSLIMLSFG